MTNKTLVRINVWVRAYWIKIYMRTRNHYPEVEPHACLATWHSLPLKRTGGGRYHDDFCFVVKSVLHRIYAPNDFRNLANLQ